MNARKMKTVIILLLIILFISPLTAKGSADFDNSLTVDLNDLKLFTDYWLYDYNDNRKCASWDLSANGQIDFYDLNAFVEQWLLPYDFGDFSDFGHFWGRTVDYRFEDTRFDLTGDGFVNMKDFSSFASEWMTTKDCCLEDTNVSGPWQYVSFTNVSSCGPYDCWMYPGYSDPCNDKCGHSAYVSCAETPEFDFYCAYNFWFAGRRVGLCVYTCGINAFQIKKNVSRCRILQTRHRTQDRLDISGCDEGTIDKYDWQINRYDDINGVRTFYCRESILDPLTNNLWEPSEGEQSTCEISW